jgi:excisionase family DNA binding protein
VGQDLSTFKEETKMTQRFIQLSDVSEILDISSTQAYALVRSGELNAIKVGGRGQWRVEATELENYIQRMYSETKTFVAAHPFGAPTENPDNTQ